MIITTLIGAANDGYHKFAVFPHLSVSHRRFELFLVFFNPLLELNAFKSFIDGI